MINRGHNNFSQLDRVFFSQAETAGARPLPADLPPANALNEIYSEAINGNQEAKHAFASRCDLSEYYQDPVVKAVIFRQAEKIYRDFNAESALPPTEQLYHLSYSDVELHTTYKYLVDNDQSINIRRPAFNQSLFDGLGLDTAKNFQQGSHFLNRIMQNAPAQEFTPDDLEIATDKLFQYFLRVKQFNFQPDSSSPLAAPARDAYLQALNTLFAAAILDHEIKHLPLSDDLRTKILSEQKARIKDNPWSVVDHTHVKRITTAIAEHGIELLKKLDTESLTKALKSKNHQKLIQKIVAEIKFNQSPQNTEANMRDLLGEALESTYDNLGGKQKSLVKGLMRIARSSDQSLTDAVQELCDRIREDKPLLEELIETAKNHANLTLALKTILQSNSSITEKDLDKYIRVFISQAYSYSETPEQFINDLEVELERTETSLENLYHDFLASN